MRQFLYHLKNVQRQYQSRNELGSGKVEFLFGVQVQMEAGDLHTNKRAMAQ